MDKEWLNIIETFGGEHSWLDFWTQVKLCEHEFIEADLIKITFKITNVLDKDKSTFFIGQVTYTVMYY